MQAALPWRIGTTTLLLGERPLWMGIVNATPDSFSDGGQFQSHSAAVDHALQLVADGADILDIGGESTRPGAEPVPCDEELRRVIPLIQSLRAQTPVLISIDTYKSTVAREALAAGANIINDISGLRFDPHMAAVARETRAGVIGMHMQGTPQTMQQAPAYQDVIREIQDFFKKQMLALQQQGIAAEQCIWDPGVGFGKTAAHNLELLSQVQRFRELGRPILIGHSRKRFLKSILGRELDHRLAGTIGVSLAVANQGADIIRVHDVASNRDAWAAFQACGTITEQTSIKATTEERRNLGRT